MGKERQYERSEALAAAESFVSTVEGYCERVLIAGSIRREKALVGDVEIVIQESQPGRLWRELDMRLYRKEVQMWRYKQQDGTYTTRWGERYRGINWRGVKTEVFLADADSWGYQTWLRTGPGDANTWIMSELKQQQSPVRMRDGYVWECIYPETWTPENDRQTLMCSRKLHVPDERTLFALLGLPYVAPAERTEMRYAGHYLHPLRHPLKLVDFWAASEFEAPVKMNQKTMF